ncbi:Transcriptional repressor poly-beta-hydroxybutyrate-responsive [Trema orientale]|uniref:Transcriptional repressor poly-beta-hydroxybutyrate-responsive n=1 Tax=Trema orientale TaxID=63057 RepID=A0A2P5FSR4_TREOI|nr:Transcriptional repressor poly-beta-hydroxybutyrate-responsive [Trema orientale]
MAAINTAAAAAANSNSSVVAAAAKSPRHVAGDGVGSPQSRRATRAGASPWTQIVRGESEPIATVPSSPSALAATEQAIAAAAGGGNPSSSSSSSPPPSASSSPSLVEETVGESSESGTGPNGNAGKRTAWNKPSNGAAEVGPVMGADTDSWPDLHESTRASAKSSSESLKGLSDGLSSGSISQGSGTTVSTTTPSQKHAHPNSTPAHPAATRQRSFKRNNSNASSNGGLPQQQAPASQAVEIASNNPSPREHSQRTGFGSHSDGSGDHPQQRNSFRNRNGGSHPRGDGSHHHNYGGRRDQDRGNHEWNSRGRSFNGRDPHMQQQRVDPRVYRGPTPPPSPGPFIPPHPLRPYGTPPMGFPGDLGPPVVYVAHPPPFVAPMPPVFIPAPDPQLHSKIVNQIDYYFSNENLIKDTYLRKNMDDQGWVPIKLIAGFNKVLHLTDNIQLILEAVRMSNVLEVQGDKVRRRNEWGRWLIPAVQFPNVSRPQTPGTSSHDMLAAHVQRIALEGQSANISSSGQGNYQPQLSNGDGSGPFGVQAGADRSISGRN